MENVDSRLERIFLYRTGIDFAEKDVLKTMAFFGKELNIPPRELVMVLFDVEKEFGVDILREEIVDLKIDTYNKIKKILSKAKS